MRTDDPIRDAIERERYLEDRLESCPICSVCQEYIQDEYAYKIDGEMVCKDCIESCKVYLD